MKGSRGQSTPTAGVPDVRQYLSPDLSPERFMTQGQTYLADLAQWQANHDALMAEEPQRPGGEE